jgi:hypothetical protein
LAPKRGGPKEEEDEISKELNTMAQDGKTDSEINPISNINAPTEVSENINRLSLDDPRNKQIPQTNIHQNLPDVNLDILNTNTTTSIDLKQDAYKNENFPKTFTNPNILPHPVVNHNQNKMSSSGSVLAADFKVDSKISKKLDFSLPVQFKTLPYFRLCDVIKKQLDTGLRELNGNKLEKTLAHAELAYYYLDNIVKN